MANGYCSAQMCKFVVMYALLAAGDWDMYRNKAIAVCLNEWSCW